MLDEKKIRSTYCIDEELLWVLKNEAQRRHISVSALFTELALQIQERGQGKNEE